MYNHCILQGTFYQIGKEKKERKESLNHDSNTALSFLKKRKNGGGNLAIKKMC